MYALRSAWLLENALISIVRPTGTIIVAWTVDCLLWASSQVRDQTTDLMFHDINLR